MKIFTNQGNPFGLKLIILSNLAKKSVTVEIVNNLNDKNIKEIKQLPILELDNGIQIFSTIAAAKYLLPIESDRDNKNLLNEWLEWSTTLLAPALAHNSGFGHRADANTLNTLNALIQKLEDTFKNTPYLIGDKLSSADISVWCLLTPDDTLKNAQNIDNLLKWYKRISDLNEVKSALEIQSIKNLHFTSLQQSNHFGGLHHIILPQIKSEENDLNNTGTTGSHLSPDSPTHLAETITEDEISNAKMHYIIANLIDVKEEKIVLPKKNERNVLITSALPYVNNVPHLGNIIGCVLSADIFARYSRLCGYNTLFICGTDEYGTATETKAMAENLTPKQICDKYFDIHNGIYRWFGIGFDYFGRTTTQEQTEIVQTFFKEIYEEGYIITESVEQLLCQKCDRYLADRFVEGTCPHLGCGYEDARGDQCDKCGKLVNATELIRPRCKICTTAPVLRHSDQLFLNLPKIEPELRSWFESTEHGWTNNARVITRAWLKEGLRPRCITRDLKWGIPVPLQGFEKKVFYVWFDAPFGYISITSRYTKEYKKWWQPDKDIKVELFQFMAKDNVPFHSVMFPASLLAIDKGYTLVSHIMATEYLNYEDGKFSKSRGIGVFGNDAQDTGIPSDVWRFYLASARPEGQDSSFSWNDLAARNNSELLNNLGNFINRALVFCEKNFNSTIPEMNLTNDEFMLLALINREIKGYINSMEKAKFRDAIRHILSISRHGNQYVQSTQPWVLLKGTADDQKRAGTVIAICCNLSCILATLLFPFMPTTSRNIYAQLNTKQKYISSNKPFATILLQSGHKIGKPKPLFQKIEQNRIDELKKKYSGSQNGDTTGNNSDKIVNKTETKKQFKTIAEAEEAIKIQGDRVRSLKASGIEKSLWQPEVNVLLDMKKQLTELQQQPIQNQNGILQNNDDNSSDKEAKIKQLELDIAKQGDKVRSLKATTNDSTVWKPEVDVLLSLKKELANLTGTAAATNAVTSGKKKKK